MSRKSPKGEDGQHRPPNTQWNEQTLVKYDFRFGKDDVCVGVARLGVPRPDGEQVGEWVCAFQVLGLTDDRVRFARSTDGLQAVTIASGVVRKLLDSLESVTSEVVPHWIEFPRYLPFCYGEKFHKQLCDYLDDEIKTEEQRIAREGTRRKSDS